MKYIEKKSASVEKYSAKNVKVFFPKDGDVSDTLEVFLLFEKRKLPDPVFNAWTNLDGNRVITLRTSIKQWAEQAYQLRFNRRDLRMALNLLEQDSDPSVTRKANDLFIGDSSEALDVKGIMAKDT